MRAEPVGGVGAEYPVASEDSVATTAVTLAMKRCSPAGRQSPLMQTLAAAWQTQDSWPRGAATLGQGGLDRGQGWPGGTQWANRQCLQDRQADRSLIANVWGLEYRWGNRGTEGSVSAPFPTEAMVEQGLEPRQP